MRVRKLGQVASNIPAVFGDIQASVWGGQPTSQQGSQEHRPTVVSCVFVCAEINYCVFCVVEK